MSPADRALTPFWSLCEEADVAVLLHAASEQVLRSTAWSRVREFDEDRKVCLEFVLDPLFFSSFHYGVQNYLGTMVVGGVFERHPRLRFGIIEAGADWIGPLADHLDLWASRFTTQLGKIITMKPSDYIARNVRVSGFCFESFATYFDRYSELSDVYCYASDYPHIEGGSDQLEVYARDLAGLDARSAEKFFVSNAEWILPPSRASVAASVVSAY
jgi:predicted TIM-barrel fold metal-dependent hydrolase